MKQYFYPAVFHTAEEGGFWVSFPDLPECLTEGDTTADTNNGVVLLPERVVFDESNVNNYNF